LRFTTGEEIHNIVYTTALTPALLAFGAADGLHNFAEDHPLVVSDWAGSSGPFDRFADGGLLFLEFLERCAIGWTARSWNGAPSLVEDAEAGRLTPTRWGRDVQRAMLAPLRSLYPPRLSDTPAREEKPYPPDWPTL
jgi:hypothetical protein